MNDILSQADLDALVVDMASSPSEQPVETPDMDKLFGDLMALQAQAPDRQASETGEGDQSSGSENLSQDQIDELLKQFLG